MPMPITDEHWTHLKRVLRYVKQTSHLKLVYQRTRHTKEAILIGFADADYAEDKTDRKPISGYAFKVYGSLVSWSTRKQSTVSKSSTEVDYVALSNAASEAVWIREILKDIGVKIISPTTIYEDNQSTIKIAEDDGEPKRLKHIDVKHHYIRELIALETIKLDYVTSKEQMADIFTKGLTANT